MLLLPFIGLAIAALAALFPLALALFVVTVCVRDELEDLKADGLHWFLTLGVMLPLALATIAADALFNMTWGVILFREWRSFHSWHGLPMPDLFSDRVERHYRTIPYLGDDWRDPELPAAHRLSPQQNAAVWWAHVLNAIDMAHITMAAKN